MFDAKFYINPNPDFANMPCFSFLNTNERENFWMLGELVFCDKEYILNNVLPNLEKVVAGISVAYEFGYDATIIEFYTDKAIINYNYFEDKVEIPSKDMYRFMHEWGDYLMKWKLEQENKNT